MQLLTLTVQGSGTNEYTISVNASTGKAQCTCPAYYYSKNRKACKHIKFAAAALAGSTAGATLSRTH